MKIRLIKRGQESNKKEPQAQPKESNMVVTMQSWIDEFKTRKNKLDLAAVGLGRQE